MPESIDSNPAAPTLEYSKRPHLAWVSRHRNLLIFLALFLAIGGPIWWYWKPLKHRVLWLYWFDQATKYQMPAKSVDLFITDTTKATLALATPDYVPPATGIGANFIPMPLRELIKYDSRPTMVGGADQPLAFMGFMHRPDKTPRLVIVGGYSGITGNLLAFTSVLVFPIPKWNDPLPPAGLTRIGRGMAYSGPPPTPTHLKSGVLDPNDPSHIILEFEAGPRGGFLAPLGSTTVPTWTTSATGIIDAHLQNDDSINFTLRSFTGSDPNIRVGSSNANMIGDPQVLQTKSMARGAVGLTTTPPTTRARRSNGR